MSRWLLGFVVGLASFSTAIAAYGEESASAQGLLDARLSTEQLEEGWIRLFDGSSLLGWEDTGKANWRVEEGAIVADEGINGLLCSTVSFSNYELKVEFLAEEETNSGVFLRTPPIPEDPSRDCFELNIAPDSNPFPTGSLVYRQKRNEQIAAPSSSAWHEFRAKVVDDQVSIWLDGKECLTYKAPEGSPAKGRIGLQFREGKIAFRSVLLKPLGVALIPGNQEAFLAPVKVTAAWNDDGTLTIVGGRGHVETKDSYGDGFIQFAATTLTENVNSGLFFRCIPGEDMNGYECQLHHGFTGDREHPVDSGTGAIFRRQQARVVLSDEGKKAFVTIVTDGAKIATWVHGVQVVDWTDTRKADLNPRRGLRLQPGSIMLQGHDPGCQVRFEELRVGN